MPDSKCHFGGTRCLPKKLGRVTIDVASTQEEIRRLARDDNALQPEAASSISSGLSIVGKITGHGALTIFGHVEGEVRASTIVIAEGAQIEGKVSAEELTIGGG